MDAKSKRQKTISDQRRALVLVAAERVALRMGLEQSSMREIAKEAGYTPGALYAYFESRDHLMCALLEQVVHRLTTAVSAVRPGKAGNEALMAAKASAWMVHLQRHAIDRQLLLYFFAGLGRANGNDPQIQGLRRAVRQTLLPVIEAVTPQEDHADSELDAILAQGLGLIMVCGDDWTRTGGDGVIGAFLDYLHLRFVSGLIQKTVQADTSEPDVAQIDLFN
jgi:AcrR family transcriptional regulator